MVFIKSRKIIELLIKHKIITGDSGSGFVMYKNNAWRLRGIVSNSLQNPETRICDVTNFAVFTDVPKFSSWINNNIEI